MGVYGSPKLVAKNQKIEKSSEALSYCLFPIPHSQKSFELPGRWVWCYFASGQIGRGKKRLIGKGRSVFDKTQLLFLPFGGPWVPVSSSLPTEKMTLLSGKWPCRSP